MGCPRSTAPGEGCCRSRETLAGDWWPHCNQFSSTLWRQVVLGCLCLRGTTSDSNGLVLGQPSRGPALPQGGGTPPRAGSPTQGHLCWHGTRAFLQQRWGGGPRSWKMAAMRPRQAHACCCSHRAPAPPGDAELENAGPGGICEGHSHPRLLPVSAPGPPGRRCTAAFTVRPDPRLAPQKPATRACQQG